MHSENMQFEHNKRFNIPLYPELIAWTPESSILGIFWNGGFGVYTFTNQSVYSLFWLKVTFRSIIELYFSDVAMSTRLNKSLSIALLWYSTSPVVIFLIFTEIFSLISQILFISINLSTLLRLASWPLLIYFNHCCYYFFIKKWLIATQFQFAIKTVCMKLVLYLAFRPSTSELGLITWSLVNDIT